MLEVQALTREFGGVRVLDEVSFAARSGDCFVLLGHNGAGKTTAMRLVAGRLDPTGGSVMVAGASPHAPGGARAARRALSFVPDDPLLFDDLTVMEHVQLVAAAHAPEPGEATARLSPAEALERLDVSDLAQRLPGTLSRGQRQRVQLACAVARPFDVLVLDEPVVGLDPRSQTILFELIQALQGEGVAMLVSTHQIGFARAVGTRALVLSGGRQVFEGSVESAAEALGDLAPW